MSESVAPSIDLLPSFQHAVLLDELLDQLGMMVGGPACERGGKELEEGGSRSRRVHRAVRREGVSCVVAVPSNLLPLVFQQEIQCSRIRTISEIPS